MRLIFHVDHSQRRPELGTYRTRSDSDSQTTGLLKFDEPGSAIRIVASMPDAAPVDHEAMPNSAHGEFKVERTLIAGRSISPGVWQWRVKQSCARVASATQIGNLSRSKIGNAVRWLRLAVRRASSQAANGWLLPPRA
jgi:hypothetical protein